MTPGEPPLLWAVLPFVRGFTRRHSDTQHLDSFPWWSGNVFSSARLYTRLLQSMVTGDKRRRRPAPTLKMASCCVQPGRGSGLPALGLTGRGADGRGGSLGTFPTFSGGDLRGRRGLGSILTADWSLGKWAGASWHPTPLSSNRKCLSVFPAGCHFTWLGPEEKDSAAAAGPGRRETVAAAAAAATAATAEEEEEEEGEKKSQVESATTTAGTAGPG